MNQEKYSVSSELDESIFDDNRKNDSSPKKGQSSLRKIIADEYPDEVKIWTPNVSLETLPPHNCIFWTSKLFIRTLAQTVASDANEHAGRSSGYHVR